MGRLFWKFFAFAWLAQLAGIIAIAFIFWLTEPRLDRAFNDIEHGPSTGTRLDAASAILRYAGRDAFGNWSTHEPGPPVYVVDDADRDILGRAVDPHLVSLARDLQRELRGRGPVREALLDGQRYAIFGVGGGAAGIGPASGGSAQDFPRPDAPPPGGGSADFRRPDLSVPAYWVRACSVPARRVWCRRS